MNPDTLAGVCARPAVCRIWAKPYSRPRTIAVRRLYGVNRATDRGNSANVAAAAIANRTAR